MTSTTTRLGLASLLLAGAAGCSSEDTPDETPMVDARRALLTSVQMRVIVPGFRTFATDARALATEVQSWSDAVGAGGMPDRGALDQAFATAYRSMQYAELLQVGPYGAPSRFAGGKNIRDEVYSWPTANPCRVDQELVSLDYQDARFFETSLVNVYGFDALEYLLYASSDGNACPASAPLNTSGDWAALSVDEVRSRRAAYAAIVAVEIARRAEEIRDLWLGEFADELSTAGDGSATYDSTQEGLDAIFASMFYAEKQVKDAKLGVPLGISPECPATVCPEDLESDYAQLSMTAIEANLEAFSDLYRGGPDGDAERSGFGELLRSLDAGQLADDMDAQLNAALARVDPVQDPLQAGLEGEAARALHTDLRTLMTTFKTQFVSVLNLRVPNEGAADND